MMQNLKIVSVYLFVLRVIRMAMSIVTVALSAKYFGISVERDIWVLVSAFLATINLAIWGPLNEIFRTKFIFIREQEGEREALSKTASLLSLIVIGTCIISALIYMFPEELMHVIAPSVGFNQKMIFVKMLYWLIPTFLINELITIGTSILNAYDSFYVPEVVNFFSGLLNILCLILLAPLIGINSLIVSMYLSLFLLLIVLLYVIYKKRINFIFRDFVFSWKKVRPFVLFSIPFFIPYFVSQCNAILEKTLANLLGTGFVSLVDYSRRFTDVLLSVFISVFSAVLVPILSQCYSNHDRQKFSDTFREYSNVVILLLSLTLPLLIGGARPLVTFFYYRGDITMEVVYQIVFLTQLYGVAFIGVAFYVFFGVSLLAQDKGRKYATFGALAQLIMIAFNLLLYRILGVKTFAISLFVSHLCMALLMYKMLDLEQKSTITTYLGKGIILLCLLVVVQIVLSHWFLNFEVLVQLLVHVCMLFITLPLFARFLGFSLKGYMKVLKQVK